MRSVPGWAVFSSACAPLVLIAGWAIAAVLEGPTYDPATTTISVLGAYGGAGFWVMTTALLALGVCHLVTAWGLRAAAAPGRLALAGGGLAAFAVTVFPAPSSGGSLQHGAVAVVGFALMALWPVLAARRESAAPWGLRPGPCLGACAVMGVSALWFLVELQLQGVAGAAERLVTSIQSLWPFVVVVSCRRRKVVVEFAREAPDRRRSW
ncbi:DUF998 domain-containing protein [Streptomyces sp. NPDC088387]|uniref:DUF998 domain-containing protein n=1 Tax=Streptomyces sp. NPDC088387 TaxID=3365859 RepID=UPI003805B8E2